MTHCTYYYSDKPYLKLTSSMPQVLDIFNGLLLFVGNVSSLEALHLVNISENYNKILVVTAILDIGDILFYLRSFSVYLLATSSTPNNVGLPSHSTLEAPLTINIPSNTKMSC